MKIRPCPRPRTRLAILEVVVRQAICNADSISKPLRGSSLGGSEVLMGGHSTSEGTDRGHKLEQIRE